MNLRPLVTGVLILAVIVVGILGVTWAVGAEYETTPETNYTVVNESIVMNTSSSNWTEVDEPAGEYELYYLNNETARNSSGAVLDEGIDYEWNDSDGTVFYYNSSDVTPNATGTITYTYHAKTALARGIKGILGVPIRVALPLSILVVLAVAMAGLAIMLVRKFSGGTRRRTRNFGR